ncbi:BTB/POZ domain-containing protein 2-like [Amphibalanus amphitrite]|uniref:BTB/POZ domain-containing protein 2-like n=1 Tax=Amphibalanus amphitrite TaxID=1232801 RepID=UPI001C90B9F6|nr:BTB/POZ domain-containing protein 2-like [Amphibalanus amphitrite]XP_043199942.1 BTB/POZ domain-containing protein 2-like [Amphibalanus amphitrite]XP_043199943.1 BTB/POZ domain-containing protein 2-like [Amphibalanus amphitrite]XP_043199945.1 BTB/POZ domain-containing protein 2-like [Amphibalanus amphitrite]
MASHNSGAPPRNSGAHQLAEGVARLRVAPATAEAAGGAAPAARHTVPHNWQATKSTVVERIAYLFNSAAMCDVRFVVGRDANRQVVPAHKFVLSIGSAVFDAMFNSSLSTEDEFIALPDVEPQAFLALLRFLYTDEVLIGPETVMTILYTAKKYAVPALERECVDFLERNLSPDNAFMLLTQARLFDEPELAALCLDTIDKSTAVALVADGFVDIDRDTLCAVLERNMLRIRESRLFAAVLRWAEAACRRHELPPTPENLRSQLGDALYLVRFPLMSVEEFAAGPAQSGVLTDREVVQLFLYFTVNPKPRVSFSETQRSCMMGVEQSACRFSQVEARWGYSGTSDRIMFSVDRRIFVVGFGIYGAIHGPSEHGVTIGLVNVRTGEVLASHEVTVFSDGSESTFRAMFPEPLEVEPAVQYIASVTLKGLDSYYGTHGSRLVPVECASGGGKVTFHFEAPIGNNNGTSVEDGQIPEIIFYV